MVNGRNRIYSRRKGSVQWNEDDRLQLIGLLAKAGYSVRIGRSVVKGKENKQNAQMEYFVEYWEEGESESKQD